MWRVVRWCFGTWMRAIIAVVVIAVMAANARHILQTALSTVVVMSLLAVAIVLIVRWTKGQAKRSE